MQIVTINTRTMYGQACESNGTTQWWMFSKDLIIELIKKMS